MDEGIRCAMCTNTMKSDRGCDGGCVVNDAMYKRVMEVINKAIVQEVAKEYGKDTNVHSKDEFDVIYHKVCELEKKYAKCAEDWESVNRCIRLENLLMYFKEELKAPYQKGE